MQKLVEFVNLVGTKLKQRPELDIDARDITTGIMLWKGDLQTGVGVCYNQTLKSKSKFNAK